jgi:hypothetical protein
MSGESTFRRIFMAALAAFVLLTTASRAQLPQPPLTAEDALRQMADQADVIFTGQVTAVRRNTGANGSTGTLEIDFAVDDAVRGVAPGSLYTLREWAGASPAGLSQFEIAQRYLMLLHAPGPSGLSSPVGGPDGAIPIRGDTTAASADTLDAAGLAAATSLALAAASAPRTPARSALRMANSPSAESSSISAPLAASSSTLSVDLRWIATRVLQPLNYAPDSCAPASCAPDPIATATAHPIVARASIALSPPGADAPLQPSALKPIIPSTLLSPSPSASSQPSSQPPSQPATTAATYSSLLTLLRSWNLEQNQSRSRE